MKAKVGQYGWEKNIFFPFACQQVTGRFAAPKIDTWRHLENLGVDHAVVWVHLWLQEGLNLISRATHFEGSNDSIMSN